MITVFIIPALSDTIIPRLMETTTAGQMTLVVSHVTVMWWALRH